MKNLTLMTTLSLAAILTLSGCGESNSSDKEAIDSALTTNISGIAVDPELMDATVFVDVNNNGIFDINETSTKTDENGTFTLKVLKENLDKAIIVTGGVDKVTKEVFEGTFSALLEEGSTKQNLTPLTTLVHNYAKHSNKPLKEIKGDVALALDLNTSDLDSNPMDDANVLKVALQLESVSKIVRDENPSKSSKEIYRKYATEIESGANLTTMVDGVVNDEGIVLNELDQGKIKRLNNQLGKMVSAQARTDAFALSVANIKQAILEANTTTSLNRDFFNDEKFLVRDDEVEDEKKHRNDLFKAYKNKLKKKIQDFDFDNFERAEMTPELEAVIRTLEEGARFNKELKTTLFEDDNRSEDDDDNQSNKHSLINQLLERYELNTTLETTLGAYSNESFQALYNEVSSQEANLSDLNLTTLSCQLAVTNVNALDASLLLAQESNASDVGAIIENIREGAYKGFAVANSKLLAMDTSDGCASLGEEYNKSSIYPNNFSDFNDQIDAFKEKFGTIKDTFDNYNKKLNHGNLDKEKFIGKVKGL